MGKKEVLTSHYQNMRALYRDLDAMRKDEVLAVMQSLFDVRKIERTVEGELLIYERSESFSLEIMFCGSAFQKVLSGLILLATLISSDADMKFFLIEEIEALLYPSLVEKYFQQIKDLCALHSIKLIITSNSERILKMVSTDQKVCHSLLRFPVKQFLKNLFIHY